MFFLLLVFSCLVRISIAHPPLFASGSALNLANNTRTNATWIFAHHTDSTKSLHNLHETTTASLHAIPTLDADSSAFYISKTQTPSGGTANNTHGGQAKSTPTFAPVGNFTYQNETFHANATSGYSNKTVQAASTVSKNLSTGALKAPFLNTTNSNTTWAFAAKNISTLEEPVVASSLRVAAVAAAAVNYPRAAFAHFMVLSWLTRRVQG